MSDYVADLTRPVHDCFRRDAERLAAKLPAEATFTNGVMRWNSNNRVPPAEICALACHLALPIDIAASTAARDAETAAFVAEYRRADPRPDAEQLAEMRANFEPGSVVVNVLTGRRTQL